MIDRKKEVKRIIKFIKNYFDKNNLGGVIIGISGGKDSSVVAGLFSLAIGKENVIGVSMPCKSSQEDYEDAKLIADKFGISLINFDLNPVYDSFQKVVFSLKDYVFSLDSEINLKPRLRMSTLYYLAQMYSKKNNKTYIVAGTGNKCEEYVGYFTKGGDSVSDIKVLSDFTVDEVLQLGEEIGVPESVLYKVPNDGLSGISDEEKLGVSYSDIAKVINGDVIDENIFNTINYLHEKNAHKFFTATYCQDESN